MRAGGLARVAGNTGILAAAKVVEKGFNILLVILLVRYLSEEAFGQYGFVTAYVVLFNVFVGLGLATLCTREIARHPDQASRILTAALVPMAFASLLTFALVSISIWWTKPGQTTVVTAVILAAVDLVLNSLTALFDALPRAHERMGYSVTPRLVRGGLLLLLCLLLLPRGIGLTGVFLLVVAASAVHLGLQVLCGRVAFGVLPAGPVDWQRSWRLLRTAVPLALTSLFVIIYYRIDTVMLSYLRGDREVGHYVAATTLAFAPLFVATAFHQATFPVLSRLPLGEPLRELYARAMKCLIMAGLPLACGLAILAPRVVVLVYDARYLAASGAVQVLAIALLLMFANGFMGNVLIAMNDQKVLMRIVGVGAVLNVCLNLLAIPAYGILGAAATTAAAELYAHLSAATALRRRHGIRLGFAGPARLALCAAGMSLCLWLARAWPLAVLVPAAALVYVGLLFLTRAVDAAELARLRTLVRGGGEGP